MRNACPNWRVSGERSEEGRTSENVRFAIRDVALHLVDIDLAHDGRLIRSVHVKVDDELSNSLGSTKGVSWCCQRSGGERGARDHEPRRARP